MACDLVSYSKKANRLAQWNVENMIVPNRSSFARTSFSDSELNRPPTNKTFVGLQFCLFSIFFFSFSAWVGWGFCLTIVQSSFLDRLDFDDLDDFDEGMIPLNFFLSLIQALQVGPPLTPGALDKRLRLGHAFGGQGGCEEAPQAQMRFDSLLKSVHRPLRGGKV